MRTLAPSARAACAIAPPQGFHQLILTDTTIVIGVQRIEIQQASGIAA
jgi:hypothetical protein